LVLNRGIALRDISLTFTQGFDFRADEDDPRLKCILYGIIESRPPVFSDRFVIGVCLFGGHR